jgi:rfaE bifunctional protein kinase chain/domain
VNVASEVARLAQHRVLVVGDLVLDEYVIGRVARISREAPVPILEVTSEESRAGSAASPAANVVALGSCATVVGVLGPDAAGERVQASLRRLGVDCDGLVRWPSAATTTKTRVLAHGYTGGLHGQQQMLRLDRTAPVAPEAARACAACVARLASAHEAILLSDYRGGVVDEATIGAARESRRLIAVDSQGDVRRFRGVDLLKVNQAEAQSALGGTDLLGRGDALRRELEISYLVITLGAEGMLVFGDRETATHIPAVAATEVFDVTGAGDTVIAVLTLGLVAGLAIRHAAQLASAAASVVVRKLGVATASPTEIVAALGAT